MCRRVQEAGDADDPMRALETLAELRREIELFNREPVNRGLATGRSVGVAMQAAALGSEGGARRVLAALGADVTAVRGRLEGKTNRWHAPARSAGGNSGAS